MTGWIYPSWVSGETLLRSFSGAVMNDDAVLTHVADSQVDPWFFDDNQGFGVDAVELSSDLTTVVGIAGQSDEKLRVYRTTMDPFSAPNWDHKPFAQGNQPVAQQCYELPGKFVSTSLAPSGRAMAYGTAEGVWIAAIPESCAPGDAGALVLGGATSPDWGPADVPAATAATLRLSRRGGLTATLTTGVSGRATFTAVLKRRTIAKRTVTVNGRATVRFKLKRRGTVTVKAAFTPTGGSPQRVSAKLRLR